jgi:hypothetical protein
MAADLHVVCVLLSSTEPGARLGQPSWVVGMDDDALRNKPKTRPVPLGSLPYRSLAACRG